MNPKPIEQARNPLLPRSIAALQRAGKRAEELAIATNTALVQVIDGEIVLVYPQREQRSKSDGL